MTTVYSVAGSDGIVYHPTQAEAMRQAYADREAGDAYVEVQRHKVATGLRASDLYARLLNGQSWCAQTEEVPL